MAHVRSILTLATASLLAASSPAFAGGLYVAEFATPIMGAAGAGATALGTDASAALHNPATMTRLHGHQLNLGLAPGYSDVHFDRSSSTPVAGNDGGDQGGLVPLLGSSYVHDLSDRTRLGMTIFSVSGASLDPNNDWAGRNQVTEIQLFTLTFFPSAAVRLTDWLSVGAGPAITYGNLRWKLSAPLPSPPAPAGAEARVNLDKLDDWAVAPGAGVLLEPRDDLRIGVQFLGETNLHLNGSTKIPNGVSANTTVKLPLARSVHADAVWQATDKLALLVGGGWEDWSEAKTVPLEIGSGAGDFPLGMRDTWKLRGGVQYQLDERWLVRTGLSYDSSALRTKDRLAALPLDEQWRFGIGATYDWSEDKRVSFGFEYLNLGRGHIDNATLKGHYDPNQVFFFMVNVNFDKLPWDGMARL